MPIWTSWTGLVVTILGAVLTGVAFYFTYREARAAKTAAQAAQAAADEAKEAISERVTIADLAAIRQSFNSIVMLLELQKPEMAIQEVRTTRQRVNELRERPGFVGNADETQKLLADLANLQETIENKLWSDPALVLPLPEISKILASHSDRLSAWAEKMRYN